MSKIFEVSISGVHPVTAPPPTLKYGHDRHHAENPTHVDLLSRPVTGTILGPKVIYPQQLAEVLSFLGSTP